MNIHFIDFILENIFSDRIPIADTFFNKNSVRIAYTKESTINAFIPVVCDFALELSWLFWMVINIYHDEMNDKNKGLLIHLMGRAANRIISYDYPKPAVMIAVINIAEYWVKQQFPQKAMILQDDDGLKTVLFD